MHLSPLHTLSVTYCNPIVLQVQLQLIAKEFGAGGDFDTEREDEVDDECYAVEYYTKQGKRVLRLKKPVPTRWHSKAGALQRALVLRKALDVYQHEHNDFLGLSFQDWITISDLVDVLGPIMVVARGLEGSSEPRIHEVLP